LNQWTEKRTLDVKAEVGEARQRGHFCGFAGRCESLKPLMGRLLHRHRHALLAAVGPDRDCDRQLLGRFRRLRNKAESSRSL